MLVTMIAFVPFRQAFFKVSSRRLSNFGEILYVNIPMTKEQLREVAVMIKYHYSAYLNQFYNKFGSQMFEDKVNLYRQNP